MNWKCSYIRIIKTTIMRIILASLVLFASLHAFSQSPATYYFDKHMHSVSKKDAEIFGTGQVDSGLYKLTCYYQKRKHPLACVMRFTDSTQRIREGRSEYYYENGGLKRKGQYREGEMDGVWISYSEKGDVQESTEYSRGRPRLSTHFYNLPGSHQKLEIADDFVDNKFSSSLLDQKGNALSQEAFSEDYTDVYIGMDTVCSFPGGSKAWFQYISKAMMSHVSDFSDADYGTVLLRFVVDSDGTVKEVRPLNMKTSLLAIVGFNAIDGGPKWIPAQYHGKNVKTIMVLPLTLENPSK